MNNNMWQARKDCSNNIVHSDTNKELGKQAAIIFRLSL